MKEFGIDATRGRGCRMLAGILGVIGGNQGDSVPLRLGVEGLEDRLTPAPLPSLLTGAPHLFATASLHPTPTPPIGGALIARVSPEQFPNFLMGPFVGVAGRVENMPLPELLARFPAGRGVLEKIADGEPSFLAFRPRLIWPFGLPKLADVPAKAGATNAVTVTQTETPPPLIAAIAQPPTDRVAVTQRVPFVLVPGSGATKESTIPETPPDNKPEQFEDTAPHTVTPPRAEPDPQPAETLWEFGPLREIVNDAWAQLQASLPLGELFEEMAGDDEATSSYFEAGACLVGAAAIWATFPRRGRSGITADASETLGVTESTGQNGST